MFRQHANGANRKSEFWCINLGSSGFAGTGCNQRKSADKLQSDVIVPYLCTSSHPGSPASCKGLFQDAGLCNLPTRYRVIPIGGPVGNRMSAATAARSTGTGSIGNRSLLIVDTQTNGRARVWRRGNSFERQKNSLSKVALGISLKFPSRKKN